MGVFFYVQIYSTIFFLYTILSLIMYRGLRARISFFKFYMSKKFDKFFPHQKKESQFCMETYKFPNFSQFLAQFSSLRKKKHTHTNQYHKISMQIVYAYY
jgi:hypothetical protein